MRGHQGPSAIPALFQHIPCPKHGRRAAGAWRACGLRRWGWVDVRASLRAACRFIMQASFHCCQGPALEQCSPGRAPAAKRPRAPWPCALCPWTPAPCRRPAACQSAPPSEVAQGAGGAALGARACAVSCGQRHLRQHSARQHQRRRLESGRARSTGRGSSGRGACALPCVCVSQRLCCDRVLAAPCWTASLCIAGSRCAGPAACSWSRKHDWQSAVV